MKRQTLKKMAICVLSTTILYASSVSANAEELFSDSGTIQKDLSGEDEEKFSDGGERNMFASEKNEGSADADPSLEETDNHTIVRDGILYTYYEKSNTLYVAGYTDELAGKTEIVIPAYIDGISVTWWESKCFSGLKGIEVLRLSSVIRGIEEDIFDDWTGITIRCPLNSLAYSDAAELAAVDTNGIPPAYLLEDGVRYILDEKTGTYSVALSDCDHPEPLDIVFKSSIEGLPVVEIDTYGNNNYFDDDVALYFYGVGSMYIPSSIERIAAREFTYNLCYDPGYDVENSIKEWGFINLTSVVFEDGDTSIELGDHLFDGCDSLTEVKLSSRIRELPAYMFVDCQALTELELPEGMTKIGQAALQGVPNLEYLYIPSSVTDIADDAMDGLTKLTVHGEANSYAEYYCRTHGIPFEAEGSIEQEKPYIVSAKGELKDHWLHFTVELLREMDGAEGYEYQTLASDGETVLRTKNAAAASCVLAKAPNDIFVRVRSWKTENGEKVYSQWSDKAHLYLDVKAGNMVLKKAAANGRKVTLTFGDNANFFKESDGFDCRLEKTASNGKTYAKQNQKYRTVTFTNVKPGTYTAKARAYKLVNGKKVYGERSNTIRVTVR